jgi:hypothetical protein
MLAWLCIAARTRVCVAPCGSAPKTAVAVTLARVQGCAWQVSPAPPAPVTGLSMEAKLPFVVIRASEHGVWGVREAGFCSRTRLTHCPVSLAEHIHLQEAHDTSYGISFV